MSTANNTKRKENKNVWYEEEFQIVIWGCFKKVIMIDNQKK